MLRSSAHTEEEGTGQSEADQLAWAMEESKRMASEASRQEDDELQRAIEESLRSEGKLYPCACLRCFAVSWGLCLRRIHS